MELVRHEIGTDDTVTSQPTAWGQALSGEGATVESIAELADGTVILLTSEDSGVGLYRATVGQDSCQPLPINDWPASPYEVDGAYGPSAVLPAGDGFAAVLTDQVEYRTADGTRMTSFPNFTYLNSSDVTASNQQVMIRDSSSNLLLRYDLKTGEKLGESACDFQEMYFTLLLTDDAKFMADATGIYRQNIDGEKWEQVFSGGGTSLGAPANIVAGMASDGSDGYYVALTSSIGVKVVHYTWSDTTPTVPETELTVFSLIDYPMLHQAISEYQAQNPSVKVTLQIPSAEGATMEDTIRALNTEILNGKGPNSMVLDGLPAQSYAEKGVLLDLNTIDGLQDGLLTNLVTAQASGDALYQIPVQFTVPVMISTAGAAQPDSLDELNAQLEADNGDVPYLVIPPNLQAESGSFLMDWYTRCIPDVFPNGVFDSAKLETVLSEIQTLHGQLVADASQFPADNGIWIDPDKTEECIDTGFSQLRDGTATAHITTLTGRASLFGMRVLSEGKWQITSLFDRGSFLPQCSVGILAGSQQQSLAEQFLRVLLSQSVQSAYVGSGLPVQAEALELVTKTNLSNENGQVFSLGQQFLDLCQTLNNAISSDAMVEEAVKAQASTVLSGDSATDAANAISNAIKIYLAE